VQISDFTNIDPRTRSLVRRVLEKWNPTVEARVIELFNEGLSQSDINKIITREKIFEIPTSQTHKGGTPKYDYRGVNTIYQKLFEDGKLDPSITEINKNVSGKYATAGEIAIQDKQILDHYLENESNFKGKPLNQISKSFSAKYGLTTGTNLKKGNAISPTAVKRALENAIAGKYPDYDEHFKARDLDEFIVSRHANIFPDVNKLDKLIKKTVASNNNYLVDDSLGLQERMKRLRNEYAKEIGMATDNPKLENNFTARIRKLMNRYGGQNVERYEKALFNTIKPPVTSNRGYIDSFLHKNLMAIASHAGKMSNKDTALQLGLPASDIRLLENMRSANAQIVRKYKLPQIVKGGTKVGLAGDHTDIKALMQNFGNYKKDFLRISYIGDALNTIKASFDKKILALKRLADQGIEFDIGTKTSDVKYEQAYNKKTGRLVDLRGKEFNPKIHEKKLTGSSVGQHRRGPFSGPLTPAEIKAGGRTIPAAIKKLQKQFADLSGGYKLGGFDIKDGKVVGPKNFIQPRINERTSPVSMTIRETLGNLKYGPPGSKKIRDEYLNVVDRAILSPEGATTKGRINILKRFAPKALEGSGYLHAMKTVGEKGSKQSTQITKIIEKGMQGALDAADTNENNICSIFGMKSGGVAGGSCRRQMELAFDNAPEQTLNEVSKVGSSKVKSLVQRALSVFPKLGTPGKIAAGAVAGAAAIGALTYNKELGEFVNPLNDDKASQATVIEWIKDNPVKTVAGTSIGFSTQEIPGAYKKARDLGRGRVRSALGITGALKPVLTTFGTPAMTALFEAPFAAKRLEEGETMTEVLTDPLGPALGLSLMETLSQKAGVVRDAPKRTMAEGLKNYFNLSNVGTARPGMTSKILRMGMSPRVIAGASRFLGLPGLALSLGLTGYGAYKNYQNEEGMLYNLFNRDE
jgi:hypothetical protein